MNDAIIELDEVTFKQLGALVHRHTGITLSSSRRTMLQGRLRPRLRTLNLESFAAYAKHLERTPDEVTAFVDAVTTNETYFFRTPRVWDHLTNEFLPRWITDHPGVTFNAWSAAASNGSEASSLAVLLEEVKLKHPAFKYSILATDISNEILDEAKAGVYSGRTIDVFRKTRSDWFKRHMREVKSEHFQLAPEARARIKFQRHNLFEPLKGAARFDLVMLRNVLIYFTPPDQLKVVDHIANVSAPGSLLVIGESESLTSINTSFSFEGPMFYRPARRAA